jgi:hypothetical protein
MDGPWISLRPIEWIQTISNEGRRLIVNCKVKDDHVVLSNERRLRDLSVNLSIVGPQRDPLDFGIGRFSFCDAQKLDPWLKPNSRASAVGCG